MIFIDGDFPVKGKCKYYCSPSCHPAQVGPEWVYGCTHKAWPANRECDFVPIVKCDGDPKHCEIPQKFITSMRRGQTLRGNNLQKKTEALYKERQELDALIKLRKEATDD